MPLRRREFMHSQYDNEVFFENYKKLRANPLSYNEIVEFPEIKRQLPDVQDKKVLDVGCGFGHLLKYIKTLQPKSVSGIDLSRKMIEECKKDTGLSDALFYQGDILETEFKETFDLIVSSLALHYVEDFNQLAKKLNHLLEEGGTLLFTMEHPIQTASMSENIVGKDEEGLYMRLDHYFNESKRTIYWNGADYNVSKFHHKLDTIINSLIQNGFTIEYLKDLGDSPEVRKNFNEKKVHKLQTFPPFLLVKAKKVT